ncbi:MAG: hypothetical protein K0U74_16855 [Alphaproteobacteria bacterium]|nr:hypothetical protein [Alphaproteobacteria bacterium]
MAFSDETSAHYGRGPAAPGVGFGGPGSGDWIEPQKAPRDWKKLFLVLGLGTLSWVATYVGMLELIQSNMGGTLPLHQQVIIGFAVAMLMTMIIWLLDQIFSPVHFTTKVVYIFGYLFLTLISIGFGFGFYWKVLESRGEATRSAESAISQVQTALHAGSTRLVQLSDTLDQLTRVSTAKAIEEREKGTSCPNSSPGDGPRRKLRDADAQQFAFAGEFVKGRVGSINNEISGLDAELKKVADTGDANIDPKSGTRNEFMRGLSRRLDMTVAGFNAFRSDPQLGQIRADLAARAEKSVFPNGSGGTFACPDTQLQAALRGVVRAIDQLPVMTKPQVAAVEGSEATIEAFRRLTATLQGALVLEMPPSADELRALQKKAVQSVNSGGAAIKAAPVHAQTAGLSKRDYIPLAIAVFVDFCLLLVSIGRPINRLNGLVPVMREAERGPMIKILSRFNDIHRDPEIRQNFEVFRHVVFDMHGAYYVAVPLDAPYRPQGRNAKGSFGYGSNDAQELQHEAHLLANLFSGFEQQKIFSRVYNPFLTTKAIQKKLWRQGSKFAGCQAFRVYRFRDGAWSDMILQAVMGAAKRAEEEKQIRMKMEAEARANEPAQAPTLSAKPDRAPTASDLAASAAAAVAAARAQERTRDPLQGFDTGLKLTPEVDRPRDANGYSSVHPAVMKANGSHPAANAAATEAYSANGNAGASHRSARRNGNANGYEVAEGASRQKSRRTKRVARKPANRDAAMGAHSDATLKSAFGKYAFAAAADFSADADELDNLDQFDSSPIEPVAPPANANTAPSNRIGIDAPAKTTTAPNGIAVTSGGESESGSNGDDVVIALSDKRHNRISAADVKFAVAEPVPTPTEDPQATVTLTRETATFTVPADDSRVSTALSAAAREDDVGAIAEPPAQPQAAIPPPLPTWAVPANEPTEAEIETIEPATDELPEQHQSGSSNGEQAPVIAVNEPAIIADEPDTRWQLTKDPLALEDEEDDQTIVTIAQRLRPATTEKS